MNFLNLPFMRMAFMTTLLLGTALGLLGAFVVTKRMSFLGLGVSQWAALGAVMGSLFFSVMSFWVAILMVLGGLIILSALEKTRSAPSESWVGLLYILGASLTVLILSKAAHGEAHLKDLFFGNVLSLGQEDVAASLILLAATIFILLACGWQWIWIAFDAQSAEVSGLRLRWWNFLFYTLFAIVMTMGIRTMGVLLSFSCLLLPPMLALLLARNLRFLFTVIPVSVGLLTTAGFWGSFQFDFPTGPFLGLIFCLPLIIAALFKKP